MTPAAPLYQTSVSVQPHPLHADLLPVTATLTIWEGMAADGRQRTGYAVANALRQHMAEAETALYPAIPRDPPPSAG